MVKTHKNNQISQKLLFILLFTSVDIFRIIQVNCTYSLTLLEGNPDNDFINSCISVPSTKTFVFTFAGINVKTSHPTDGMKKVSVSSQVWSMASFPTVAGMFLIGSSDGKFGVRKTNDLTYVKDTVISGFTGGITIYFIQVMEGTNFSYASLDKKQILRLELENFETFVKVGEYAQTVGFTSKFSGERRGKRLMFTSKQDSKLLHTVDGTNNDALRIDDIKAHFFAVPSSYQNEKLFFISGDGHRSRRNYDYVVEVEASVSSY